MKYANAVVLILWVVYFALLFTANVVGIEVRGPFEFARDVIGEMR
jgi:hypothetical protein